MFRFIISGGSATFIHLAAMASLVWIGVDPLVSTSVGVVLGAVVNYLLQYYYTFDADVKHRKSIRNYVISVGFSFVSNFILFAIFHNILDINEP